VVHVLANSSTAWNSRRLQQQRGLSRAHWLSRHAAIVPAPREVRDLQSLALLRTYERLERPGFVVLTAEEQRFNISRDGRDAS